MSLRRPSMLRFSSWVTDCVETLAPSFLSLPTDKMFCHWVRLQIISEDIYTSFSFDDQSNLAKLSETPVQFMLRSFEKRLEIWKRDITQEIHCSICPVAYYALLANFPRFIAAGISSHQYISARNRDSRRTSIGGLQAPVSFR